MIEDSATEQLSAYLDGELTDTEIAELEHRLAMDPALRENLDLLRGAIDLMRTHGPVQTPPSLYGDILNAVANEPMPSGFWVWLRRPFGLPLSTLAVAMVAILVLGVAASGALIAGGGNMLRPAMSELEVSDYSRSPKSDAPEEAGDDGKIAQNSSVGDKKRSGKASPRSQDPRPSKVASSGAEKDEWADGASNAAPALDAAAGNVTGEGIVDGSGTAEPEMELNSGTSTFKFALRQSDLEGVASLYQRYAGTTKSSARRAAQIANLPDGTHEIKLTLPSGTDRNAFEQELKRRYPGSFQAVVKTDDTITLDNAVITLRLTVNSMAPASSGTYAPRINTVRKTKPASVDEIEVEEAPAKE